MGLKQDIMVQEYIKEAGGADIRCFVVGDKVIAAMKRQAKPGEFRSNLHRGGSASLIKITPEERMTAIRAAKVMGLNVAGVDILRSNHGPLVMEVNSSPGLAGIEETIKFPLPKGLKLDAQGQQLEVTFDFAVRAHRQKALVFERAQQHGLFVQA